jgi:hypothetical protein
MTCYLALVTHELNTEVMELATASASCLCYLLTFVPDFCEIKHFPKKNWIRWFAGAIAGVEEKNGKLPRDTIYAAPPPSSLNQSAIN